MPTSDVIFIKKNKEKKNTHTKKLPCSHGNTDFIGNMFTLEQTGCNKITVLCSIHLSSSQPPTQLQAVSCQQKTVAWFLYYFYSFAFLSITLEVGCAYSFPFTRFFFCCLKKKFKNWLVWKVFRMALNVIWFFFLM